MDIHINARGKYFTSWVNKEEMGVVVQTPANMIVGVIHVNPEQRLKDELNSDSGRFLAVTGAQVYTESGEKMLYATEFLLVAFDQIISLHPIDAVTDMPAAPWLARPNKEEA